MPIYLLVVVALAFVLPSSSQAGTSTSLQEYEQLLKSSNLTFSSFFGVANNPGADLGPVALRFQNSKPNYLVWVRAARLPNIVPLDHVLFEIDEILDNNGHEVPFELSSKTLQHYNYKRAYTMFFGFETKTQTAIKTIKGKVVLLLPLEIERIALGRKQSMTISKKEVTIELVERSQDGETWSAVSCIGKYERCLNIVSSDPEAKPGSMKNRKEKKATWYIKTGKGHTLALLIAGGFHRAVYPYEIKVK